MIKVRASQIFTHSMDDAVAAKKLLDAGTPFTDVVAKYSTCPSKEHGGDLGWIPEDSVQSLMGETVSEKDKGKVIGPVHSQYGYHILTISDVEVDRTQSAITADTQMNELNRSFPEVHTMLFKTFHIGLPVAGYPADETVGSVCRKHNKSETEVLAFLNSEFAQKQIETISPFELEQRIESAGTAGMALLDIREKWEWDIAMIEGSQLITRENNESIMSSLGKDQEIILIDWKLDRGPSFQKWLTQRGFTNVRCLQGGIDAWSEAVDTGLARYDIDEDDGYRYEDIIEEGNSP